MNFFAEQDRARNKTSWLVACLIAAVVGLIAITSLAVAAFVHLLQNSTDSYRMGQALNTSAADHFRTLLTPELIGSVAVAVVIVVVLASGYKLLQLSRGGKQVALALGGRLINTDTRDADERKILNVVEEMAIASGNPVPSVYLMEDTAINAFAAGFDRRDAVIGVTRGCIQQLDRDELQGVIAHEFSHIHFGDMRLNMRLVALLHGILVIGLIGYFVLRSTGVSRRKNAGAQLALGLALIIIGYCGTFFGNIIKAAVSRQREFLADASAVQFTRNPQGISGALKKIGGWPQGSKLEDKHAPEFSHLYFSNGISQFLGGMLATHPPLAERIKRIDAGWNGEFARQEPSAVRDKENENSTANEALAGFAGMAGAGIVAGGAIGGAQSSVLRTVEAQVGNPTPEHVDYAQTLLRELPETLTRAAHEPYSARAIIYALLVDESGATGRKQWGYLRENAHPVTFQVIETIHQAVKTLPRTQHLPLLELCIPALKQLSKPQYQLFKKNLIALIRADSKVSLFEWSLYRTLIHSIEEIRHPAQTHLHKQLDQCQILLSVVCYAGRNSQPEAAYGAGAKILGLPTAQGMISAANLDFSTIDTTLNALAGIQPLEKPKLLKAIAACIHADDLVTPEEAELFRAIADSLDCPIPPLLIS